jgi:hypothetical protein
MKSKNNIQSFREFKENLNISDVSDSLIGKKVIWKGKEYTIVDKHNDSDFVMIDDENNSVIGLHWNDVELVD